MARDFNGTTDRIDYGNVFDPSSNANGWTWAGWVFPDNVNRATAQYFWTAHTSGDTNVGSIAQIANNGAGSGALVMTIQRATTATSRTSNSSSLSASAWSHVAYTWSGGTAQTTCKMYVNGTEVGYATGADGVGAVLASVGSHSLGGRIFDDNRNFDGREAECGLWDVVLTAAEIAVLAARVAPILVQPSALQFYWPIVRGQQDAIAGQGGTLDGTTVVDHPRIIYPHRRGSPRFTTAVGGGGGVVIPVFMHHYMQQGAA